LCEVLEGPKSGYYEWYGKQPSRRARANEKLSGLTAKLRGE
jgi:hypothetical protein